MRVPKLSTYEKKILFLTTVALVVVFSLTLIMVQAGLRCVSPDGCLRSFCKYNDFQKEYRDVIERSSNKDTCRYNNFTS